jgi:hypothetical protein
MCRKHLLKYSFTHKSIAVTINQVALFISPFAINPFAQDAFVEIKAHPEWKVDLSSS